MRHDRPARLLGGTGARDGRRHQLYRRDDGDEVILRYFLVTGSEGTQATYHVRSENAASARFESEYPGEQVETCVELSGLDAVLDADQRIRASEQEDEDD
jgi:hypothetical protein